MYGARGGGCVEESEREIEGIGGCLCAIWRDKNQGVYGKGKLEILRRMRCT